MKKLNKRIIYSIELSVLILASLLFASYYNIHRADTREKWVKHSYEVLLQTNKIQVSSAYNELQARDYMVTCNPRFITEFLNTATKVRAELKYIKVLTADNHAIQRTIDSVTKYVDQRIAFSKKIIDVRKSTGLAATIQLIQIGDGKIYADKTASYIRMIESTENLLMAQRKASFVHAQIIMNVSMLVTAAFILAMIVMIAYRSRDESDERGRLVKELLKNDERNKKAESLANFGTWNLNMGNQTINASDEMLRIWGLDPEGNEHIIEKFIEKVHPDDQPLIREKVTNMLHQNEADAYTLRLIDNGKVKYLSSGVTVTHDALGQATGVTGYVQDITEKTLAELELIEANKELILMFNRIGEVLFSRDVPSHSFIHISDTVEQLTGYTAAEFIAEPELWIVAIHPDDRHIIESGNMQLARGEITINQYRIIRKNGSLLWVENKIIPSMNDAGEVIRIDAVIRDINEKKLAELEHDLIMTHIIQRNEVLKEFTYMVSHYLRKPVANIIGLSQMLDSKDTNLADQQTVIEQIRLSVISLDDIVKDLNQVLQVRKEMNEEKENINFSDLLVNVRNNLPEIHQKINIESDFGQTEFLLGIHNYVYSIFYNIILNSINYRREDIDTIIKVETRLCNGLLQILFSDNGKGIDLDKNGGNMFGLYRRFNNDVKGKGIGLFMVKAQVEALGGTIEVKSKLQQGTSFSILLPA